MNKVVRGVTTFLITSSRYSIADKCWGTLETTSRYNQDKYCGTFHTSNMVHTKCRAELYAQRTEEKVSRYPVPDSSVPWAVPMEDYSPQYFTAPFVLTAAWADPDIKDDKFTPVWNKLDGKVNRVSYEGEYLIDEDGRPLNPEGRTGVRGRGVLGRWGPNHAADPIVTRWKRGDDMEIVIDQKSGKQVLEFVSIQRKDSGAWAIPGGMVDPGEKVSVTVKREFMEEALDSTDTGKENIEELKTMVEQFFDKGEEIYQGYVDDPRNTDNAWMETVAFSFHDGTGGEVGRFPLTAGDDAAAVRWMEVNGEIMLYASHANFIKIVAEKLGAHW